MIVSSESRKAASRAKGRKTLFPDALSDWFVSVFTKLAFLCYDLVQTETNK